MGWQKHHIEELEELTIRSLPEPYKTWCEIGEKPYPWWKVAYMWPIYKLARKLEKWFPKRYAGSIVNEPRRKLARWYPGISEKWYPFGYPFYVSDVPDDILFPAMEEAETDFIAGRIDSAKNRRKYGDLA